MIVCVFLYILFIIYNIRNMINGGRTGLQIVGCFSENSVELYQLEIEINNEIHYLPIRFSKLRHIFKDLQNVNNNSLRYNPNSHLATL